MTPSLEPSGTGLAHPPRTGWGGGSRFLWQALKLALAALLTYAIWRGYQNPDFVLDYGAWRLC